MKQLRQPESVTTKVKRTSKELRYTPYFIMNKTQLEKMEVSKEYKEIRDRMFYGKDYEKVKQLEKDINLHPLASSTDPNLPIDDD